jgi:hypothetical protein
MEMVGDQDGPVSAVEVHPAAVQTMPALRPAV